MRFNLRGKFPYSWETPFVPSSSSLQSAMAESTKGFGLFSLMNPTWFFPRLKLAAVLAVILSITYQWTIRQDHEKNETCASVLANGNLLTRDDWKPQGCQMHNFTTEETKQCLTTSAAITNEPTRIVLVGDSRMKMIYSGFFRQLQIPMSMSKDLHHYTSEDRQYHMDFYPSPLVAENDVIKVMEVFKREPPTLLVLGGALNVSNSKTDHRADGLPNYITGLRKLVKEVNRLPSRTAVLYKLTEPHDSAIMKYPDTPSNIAVGEHNKAALQVGDPLFSQNIAIGEHNKAALQVLSGTRVKVWDSAHLLGSQRLWNPPDGAHDDNKKFNNLVQMLLNVVCSRYLATLSPNTAPIATAYIATASNPFSKVIIITMLSAIGAAIGLGLMLKTFLKRKLRSHEQKASFQPVEKKCPQITAIATGAEEGSEVSLLGKKAPSWEIINVESSKNVYVSGSEGSSGSTEETVIAKAVSVLISPSTPCKKKEPSVQDQKHHPQAFISVLKLSLILGYFVLCDRVKLLEETSKHFSMVTFGVPLLVIVIAVLSSIKTYGPDTIKKPALLSRDITDEWKGWMQYVLLVYHASGASRNLSIYMHVRVIVSAYLFLTGYGHFSRYWKTGNVGGFTRYCQVMFRLNFLTVLLCLVMGQPYMNYYFVVLVSFWYTVLHLVLASPPHLTDAGQARTSEDFARAALKIVMVAVIIMAFSSFEVFESTFGLKQLRLLFKLSSRDGLREWRFRWMLDRFSVLYGTIFALMCQAWTRFWPNKSVASRWPNTKLGTALLGALSLTAFVCYPLLLQTCDTKLACNDLHPYFTWIPILGYIFFRHHCSFFRSHFCSLFAFLGQISLELFVSQYHILLASNTHSLLVLVPGQPIINTVVTGLVFLCTAHEMSNITGDLQPTLAPSDGKKMLKNLLFAGACAMLFVCWDRI